MEDRATSSIESFWWQTPDASVEPRSASVALERMFSGRIEGSLRMDFEGESVGCTFDIPLISDKDEGEPPDCDTEVGGGGFDD